MAALTLDKVGMVYLPINIYNKPNNLRDASRGIQNYNDSVNLLEAIKLASYSSLATDLSITYSSSAVNITSSTGADITVNSASASTAGVLTAADYNLIHSGLQGVVTDSTLTGDGTSGDPLKWVGALVTGPMTGDGNATPLGIASNSITTSHIQNGTILWADLNQNGASTGQVPQWNGTGWVSSSLTGLLPTGTIGASIFHNGTTWVALTRIKEQIAGPSSTLVTLGALPAAYAPVDIYRNGVLMVENTDFTRTNMLLTFVLSVDSSEQITAIYYV